MRRGRGGEGRLCLVPPKNCFGDSIFSSHGLLRYPTPKAKHRLSTLLVHRSPEMDTRGPRTKMKRQTTLTVFTRTHKQHIAGSRTFLSKTLASCRKKTNSPLAKKQYTLYIYHCGCYHSTKKHAKKRKKVKTSYSTMWITKPHRDQNYCTPHTAFEANIHPPHQDTTTTTTTTTKPLPYPHSIGSNRPPATSGHNNDDDDALAVPTNRPLRPFLTSLRSQRGSSP